MAVSIISDVRPNIYFVFEQPSSSWGFKQNFMLTLSASLNLICIVTWMGLFGHDMHKCTHLKTNMRTRLALRWYQVVVHLGKNGIN